MRPKGVVGGECPTTQTHYSGADSMEIKVNFLDNLRLEAKFDDFTVVTDQPIRYKEKHESQR